MTFDDCDVTSKERTVSAPEVKPLLIASSNDLLVTIAAVQRFTTEDTGTDLNKLCIREELIE